MHKRGLYYSSKAVRPFYLEGGVALVLAVAVDAFSPLFSCLGFTIPPRLVLVLLLLLDSVSVCC